MVRRHWFVLLTTLGSATFCLTALTGAQEQAPLIQWRYDYNQARKEAAKKNLPLIIDFGTKDCFWCKKLDDITFRDTKVAQLMNDRFIPLKVDAEVDVNLTQALRITSYPTIVLAAPDGKIIGSIEGFQDAVRFHENLQRALATLRDPEWMTRDYELAAKHVAGADFARAIATLKNILEDDKARPIQVKARKLLQDIEGQARARFLQAKQMQEAGKSGEAFQSLTETVRLFPGLQASKDAGELLARLAQTQQAEQKSQQRSKKAHDLLVQAQEFYKAGDFLPCLDRCEIIMASFGDLPQGLEASQLAADIKNNPEWLQNACEVLGDRLGALYLALADSLLKKGQPQQAAFYLERVIRSFPGSRYAESAQIRLGQLQGTPPRRVDLQSARP